MKNNIKVVILATLIFLLGLLIGVMIKQEKEEPMIVKPVTTQQYVKYIRQEAKKIGLDPELALAVAITESELNPDARSKVGAIGIMQVMPTTAKYLGFDPHDPTENIKGGLAYLKYLVEKFGVEHGVAAYNAGPTRMHKVRAGASTMPRETKHYIKKVIAKKNELEV